ncbi:MAG: esterase-like activity of phytase family protein [Rhizobiaceae bacterium]
MRKDRWRRHAGWPKRVENVQVQIRLENVVKSVITNCVIPIALAFASCVSSNAQEAVPIGITAAKILNFKLGESNNDFGRLEFIGGLELKSDNREFGGISGFRFFPDRTNFIAVTDNGIAINGTFKRDVAGALDDVLLADISPLPDPKGNLFTRKRDSDAEALVLVGNRAFVAFENNDRINAYTIANGKIYGDPVSVFPEVKSLRLSHNKGLEALAKSPPNRQDFEFIAITEESLNAAGNHRAFLLSDGNIGELSIIRIDKFGVTDADFLANGDLIILERFHSTFSGHKIRLRQIKGETIVPGAILDGEVILEADTGFRIDNFESLDISVDEKSETYLTLISDDNFSMLQNTILLEFKYLQ